MKQKHTIRVPTATYAYIETQIECTPEEAIEYHNQLLKDYQNSIKPTTGSLSTKEWNQTIDRYLTENTVDMEQYQKMSTDQKSMMQEIKKSLMRIKNKN